MNMFSMKDKNKMEYYSKAHKRRLSTIRQHLVYATAQEVVSCADQPDIIIKPQIALYDEELSISVKGLSPQQKVTLHGETATGTEKKILFGSCGHFIADQNGNVDVSRQPSLGGTYSDVEPMGLLWSLEPAPGQPRHTRMAINFTNRPQVISFRVYSGHLPLSDIYAPDTKHTTTWQQHAIPPHVQLDTQSQNTQQNVAHEQDSNPHTQLDTGMQKQNTQQNVTQEQNSNPHTPLDAQNQNTQQDANPYIQLDTRNQNTQQNITHQYRQLHSLVPVLEVERWYKHKDVTRIEIAEGNVRGALFLPPGDGPFQGVIDMFGGSGGLIEFRAALLASRGFAAMALAYFNYKDLPDISFIESGQPYDYFEEAIDVLANHPKVCKGGIGVLGVSKGAEFALCMGSFSQKVSAVVSINGLNSVHPSDLLYKGEVKLTGGLVEIKPEFFGDEGLVLKDAFLKGGDLIPIWKSKAKYLMLVGLDDGQVDPSEYQTLYDSCPGAKQPDIQLVTYPGAGHLIEPPYNPLCRTSLLRTFGQVVLWGGRKKEHAIAQEDSWRRILHFLRTNIPRTIA